MKKNRRCTTSVAEFIDTVNVNVLPYPFPPFRTAPPSADRGTVHTFRRSTPPLKTRKARALCTLGRCIHASPAFIFARMLYVLVHRAAILALSVTRAHCSRNMLPRIVKQTVANEYISARPESTQNQYTLDVKKTRPFEKRPKIVPDRNERIHTITNGHKLIYKAF